MDKVNKEETRCVDQFPLFLVVNFNPNVQSLNLPTIIQS